MGCFLFIDIVLKSWGCRGRFFGLRFSSAKKAPSQTRTTNVVLYWAAASLGSLGKSYSKVYFV
ncbi:hypothetical protein D1164_20560 [Mariniphaga sediminis]|uniref:Uncharacterized protein n=1 Tax=Mariniphaga sediminis TaxID=1628158 RepID=A0A399CUV8_9BACT|nr:hypothetical protein D1164_20560 [Mariniphaga sediminis]